MKDIYKIILLGVIITISLSGCGHSPTKVQNYTPANVNYEDFIKLTNVAYEHRKNKIVSFDEFLKIQKQTGVVILDSRSDQMFEQKHILGAIHLDFTNFTQENLNKLIPDKNIKILIYCNNNILGDQINFADKSVKLSAESQNEKLTLALNIPTYITLYGYGYHNVYELGELVSIDNPKLIMTGNFIP